jgi:hypothetical protein
MHKLILILTIIFSFTSQSADKTTYKRKVRQLTDLKKALAENERQLSEMAKDSFYDSNVDYSRFIARVTDRDKSATTFKVYSSNKNVKFFRSGDQVRFYPASVKKDYCIGYVRGREENYFTMYVKNISSCWIIDKYFRRGTMIKVISEVLGKRVKDASMHRIVLLKRRKDFLRQMNEINHFTWSYDEQRVQVAAKYDQKILEIERAKREALDSLMTRKTESSTLTQGLSYKLDNLDRDLDFYRVEPGVLEGDRWFEDHDLGHPVDNRPQSIITTNDLR